jgi:Flp pilus assembly protein TadD
VVQVAETGKVRAAKRARAGTARGAAALALAAFLVAGCATDGNLDGSGASRTGNLRAASMMRIADKTAAQGDFTSAANFYREAHELSKSDPGPLLGLGNALARLGALDDADQAYAKALALGAKGAAPRREYGNVLLALDRPSQAVAQFEEALKSAQDPRIYNGLGVAHDMMGEHGRAQDFYRKGLAFDRENLGLRNNLGLSLSASGEHAAAIEVLKSVAEQPGATPRHRQNLALAYGLAGETERAAQVARRDLDEASVKRNLAHYAMLRARTKGGGKSAARLAAALPATPPKERAAEPAAKERRAAPEPKPEAAAPKPVVEPKQVAAKPARIAPPAEPKSAPQKAPEPPEPAPAPEAATDAYADAVPPDPIGIAAPPPPEPVVESAPPVAVAATTPDPDPAPAPAPVEVAPAPPAAEPTVETATPVDDAPPDPVVEVVQPVAPAEPTQAAEQPVLGATPEPPAASEPAAEVATVETAAAPAADSDPDPAPAIDALVSGTAEAAPAPAIPGDTASVPEEPPSPVMTITPLAPGVVFRPGAPPAAAALAAAPAHGGYYHVRLAGYGTREGATRGWQDLVARAPELYGSIYVVPEKNHLGDDNAVRYSLRSAPIPDRARAEAICRELKERGLACSVERASAVPAAAPHG